MSKEKATFAAGCFWGVEAAFKEVEGVLSTTVGYTGGNTETPSYGEVCSGKTGHAEAVEVEFDSGKVSFEELLKVFWRIHDPLQVNRQGPDVGGQYRSAVFFHSEEQKETALKSKKELQEPEKFSGKIVTEIVPAGKFFEAEEYHQDYPEKHGKATC